MWVMSYVGLESRNSTVRPGMHQHELRRVAERDLLVTPCPHWLRTRLRLQLPSPQPAHVLEHVAVDAAGKARRVSYGLLWVAISNVAVIAHGNRLGTCALLHARVPSAQTHAIADPRVPVAEEHDDEPCSAGLSTATGVEQRGDQLPRLTGGVHRAQAPLLWRLVLNPARPPLSKK